MRIAPAKGGSRAESGRTPRSGGNSPSPFNSSSRTRRSSSAFRSLGDSNPVPYHGGGAAYFYFRSQSAVGGVELKGFLDNPNFARSIDREIRLDRVPAGRDGDKLTMWMNVSGESGIGDVFYKYEFRQQAAAAPPSRRRPRIQPISGAANTRWRQRSRRRKTSPGDAATPATAGRRTTSPTSSGARLPRRLTRSWRAKPARDPPPSPNAARPSLHRHPLRHHPLRRLRGTVAPDSAPSRAKSRFATMERRSGASRSSAPCSVSAIMSEPPKTAPRSSGLPICRRS